jgi:hypothetical protein
MQACKSQSSIDDDDLWRKDVKTFIESNYIVPRVRCPQLGMLFNVHHKAGRIHQGVSYPSIRQVFTNKRPPTDIMRMAFLQLKDLQLKGQLLSILDLPLRGYSSGIFSSELLAMFHMWTLTYKLCATEFPPITEEAPISHVERRIELFLQFCRGRFKVDHDLFRCNNLKIFQDQYCMYVERITPKDEGAVIN